MTKLCLGFITNPQREDLVEAVREAMRKARAKGFDCAAADVLQGRVDAASFSDCAPQMLLAFGGDGMILRTVPEAIARDIPFCGINLGHIGFLSSAGAGDVDAALDAIAAGSYWLETCMTLTCRVQGKEYACVNDVLFYKESFSGILGVQVCVDGTDAGTVFGDGLIVSTPTGATGYSISAGGPVIAPGVEASVITPICPHSLTFRPIVAPACAELCFKTDRDAHLAIDGTQSADIAAGEPVWITRAGAVVKFVRIGQRNLYSLIRDKLC